MKVTVNTWKPIASYRAPNTLVYEVGTFSHAPDSVVFRTVETTPRQSSGAFYDDSDHPEGAIAWALATCEKDAAKRAEWCK